LSEFSEVVDAVVSNVSKKIVGKKKEVELIIASLLSGGHVLLEGVPGVAKTLMAKTIALSLGLEFKRIQATPDMLPGDIIGYQVYDEKSGGIVFRKGPIFTNILFVDEVNRAPPKTQAALLEAMQERQVSVGGITYKLPSPFLVIATQNPVEMEGVFPLPEAYIDRFLVKVVIDYPTPEETVEILRRYDSIMGEEVKPVANIDTVIKAMNAVKRVRIDDNILRYIANIVEATRKHPMVKLGASPRGAIALMLLSRALALMRGRDYVTPDDVKYVAVAALSHRIILRSEARLSKLTPEAIVKSVLEEVEPP